MNHLINSVPKIDNDFSVLQATKIYPNIVSSNKENCKLRKPSTAGVDLKSPEKLRYFFTQASTIYLKNKKTGNDFITKPIMSQFVTKNLRYL